MLLNLYELLDIFIMTAVIGYLFHDIFRKPHAPDRDVLDRYRNRRRSIAGISHHDVLWAALLIAPTILLHELAHKFTAISFGLSATFYSACSSTGLVTGQFLNFYCGLTLVTLILKAAGFGFLFFVPAFVSVGAGGTVAQSTLIAFAGPMVHLVCWLGAAWYMRDHGRMHRMRHKHRLYLFFFKQINMFLFVFNMLPIPGFDGYQVFAGLIRMIV